MVSSVSQQPPQGYPSVVLNQQQLPQGCPPITVIQQQPPITINNNINTEKPKDDKKDKKSDGIGSELYPLLELYVIHRALLNYTDPVSNEQIYRLTYMVAMAAGAAFAIYKSMQADQKVGLEQRAEQFGKGSLTKKGSLLVLAYIKGPGALILLKSIAKPLGNLVPVYWGFNLGLDLSTYTYNILFSKK